MTGAPARGLDLLTAVALLGARLLGGRERIGLPLETECAEDNADDEQGDADYTHGNGPVAREHFKPDEERINASDKHGVHPQA